MCTQPLGGIDAPVLAQSPPPAQVLLLSEQVPGQQSVGVPKLDLENGRFSRLDVMHEHRIDLSYVSRTDGKGDARGRPAPGPPGQCPITKRQKSDA